MAEKGFKRKRGRQDGIMVRKSIVLRAKIRPIRVTLEAMPDRMKICEF
jgi:hypothetical protein